MTKYKNNLGDLIGALKALSDESRLRALAVLENGELCVCQITELLALAPSTVSKHMSLLKSGGFIESRKDGRWIYYRLSPGGATLSKAVMDEIRARVRETSVGQSDGIRIKEIVKQNPEELCKKQCKR